MDESSSSDSKTTSPLKGKDTSSESKTWKRITSNPRDTRSLSFFSIPVSLVRKSETKIIIPLLGNRSTIHSMASSSLVIPFGDTTANS